MKKGRYYNKFDFFNMKSSDLTKGYIISNFRTYQQTKQNSCGPCCVKMVLEHYNKGVIYDEDMLCKEMHTKDYPLGTTLIDIVNWLKDKNFSYTSSLEHKKDKDGLCFSSYEKFRSFILRNLKQGNPIIVENVEYGGHYRVIIGLDIQSSVIEEDMLIFADSEDLNDCSGQDGYSFDSADKFYSMWFDVHCLNANERKQPFIVIKK